MNNYIIHQDLSQPVSLAKHAWLSRDTYFTLCKGLLKLILQETPI